MTFTVHPVPGSGAEDVVVAPDGHVCTGTEDGSIFRLSPDGHHIDRGSDGLIWATIAAPAPQGRHQDPGTAPAQPAVAVHDPA